MATLFFSFGGLFQVSILLVNSIAILSEDRFLARSTHNLMQPAPKRRKSANVQPQTVGWGSSSQSEPSFGGPGGQMQDGSVKSKMINLINSVRTLMRIPLIFLNLLIIVWSIAFG